MTFSMLAMYKNHQKLRRADFKKSLETDFKNQLFFV